MVNLLRLGLLLFAVWLGLELSSKGLPGSIAALKGETREAVDTSAAAAQHKAGAALHNAHAAGEARRERMLGE